MLNNGNNSILHENFYSLIKSIQTTYNFSASFDINFQSFENILPLSLLSIEYIINKYEINQRFKSIMHLYQTCKLKEEIKKKTSNKFCILCLLTLLKKIEDSSSIPSLFISFIYEGMNLYLKEIVVYQNNQNDIIYFINVISSYLYKKIRFNDHNDYSILFKHNIDLMKNLYLQCKDQSPIIFFCDLLSKLFLSDNSLSSNYDFIRTIYLDKLFEFTCEENILISSNLKIFLNNLFRSNSSKELFLVDPLNKFIDYFTDIKNKNELQLQKEISYLTNQIELIHFMNTHIKNDKWFLLNEMFYINENLNSLITSQFNQTIKYPLYIVFAIKMIYNDNVSINDGQQPSFYLMLCNNKNTKKCIKIIFHKGKREKEINITIEIDNIKNMIHNKVTSNETNLIILKIKQEKNILKLKLLSTQFQGQIVTPNIVFISSKPMELNQIDIGIENNDKKMLICELGKILVMNKSNKIKSKTLELFKLIIQSYFTTTLDFSIFQQEEERSIFKKICLISPLAIIYNNKKDDEGNYFFSLPDNSFSDSNTDIEKSIYVYKINININKNFYCVRQQIMPDFLLEMEGFSYLIIHCEYYYQILIQHKENTSRLNNILPLM